MVQLRRSTRSWSAFLPLVLAGMTLSGLAVTGCTSEPGPVKDHPIEVLPARSFTRAWAIDLKLEKNSIRTIDVRDDRVYAYSKDKHVFAVDRKSGKFLFEMKVYSPVKELRPLVELKDKIVFPNATTMEVYDFEGNHERSVELPKSLMSDASGYSETVYFGSVGKNGGLVESYDLSDAKPTVAAPFKWEFMPRLGGEIIAAPAVYNGIIYSASTHGEIDAVTDKRDVAWDTDQNVFLVGEQLTPDRAGLQDNEIDADLQVDESGLYAVSKNGVMFCINRGSGKLQWQYFAAVPMSEPPVLAADTVYLKVPGSGIVAIDKGVKGAFNRTPRWQYPTATQFLAQDAKYAYLAEPTMKSDDDVQMYHVIAVDKATGKLAFASDRDDFTVLGSNKKDATIYGGFADGSFMGITPVLKPGTIGELVMGEPADAAIALAAR